VLAFVLLSKPDKGCEFSVKFNLQFPFLRHETDSLDQATDYFGCLRCSVQVIQRSNQVSDFSAIYISQAWMQPRLGPRLRLLESRVRPTFLWNGIFSAC